MKTLHYLAIALSLSGSVFAKNVSCRANQGMHSYPFEIVYDWSGERASMSLKFEQSVLWGSPEKFEVIYQGIGAADFNAKPQSELIAVPADSDMMIQILWEQGTGFGYAGFGKGTMKLGQRMQPGGAFGKYSTYEVVCD